ncbi:MAG: FHA domain-containing protein [Pirellulaceae bacterium]
MWLVSAWPVGGNLPFELKPGEYTIGRSPEQPIVIYDSSISRIHARLRVGQRGDITIEDLGSRNGVDVNGKLTQFGGLNLNDRIRLGAVPCLITPERQLRSFALDEDSTQGGTTAPGGRRLPLDIDLSPPQMEVLHLIAEGLTEVDVAAQTGRSYHMVHNHVRVIYKLLGVHSRGELLSRLKSGPQM